MTEQNEVHVGTNRTGAALAPERIEAMIAGTEEFYPSSEGDGSAIIAVRAEYAQEAEPIGTVPPPATLKGIAKTAFKALKGGEPTLFLDKLGERLAFERTGTRLYEALLGKIDNLGSFDGGPSSQDVASILRDEYEHFRLLEEAITRLSGDPTAVTPSANLAAVASHGVAAVIVDPRTTLLQCLEAILIAELVDNDSWEALIELAQIAGEEELVASFTEALDNERSHLAQVRMWIAAGQGRMGEAPPISRSAARPESRALADDGPIGSDVVNGGEEPDEDIEVEVVAAAPKRKAAKRKKAPAKSARSTKKTAKRSKKKSSAKAKRRR